MPTPKPDVVVAITDKDLAVILFALRYLQANMDDAKPLMRGSEHFIDVTPHDSRGIDRLCQHLNGKYLNICAKDVEMSMNLAHTVLIEATSDRRIMGILERFDISPDEANMLQAALEIALNLGEEGGSHGSNS